MKDENKIENKQISIRQILEVANYYEDCKEKYDKLFREDQANNKDKKFSESDYKYFSGETEVKYRIEFKDGKTICEKGYNWFLGNLSNPKIIQSIEIEFRMNYSRKTESEKKYHDEFTNLNADIRFSDYTKYNRYSDATINIRSTMHEDEAYDMYSVVKEILERNDDRFNNTIKNRKIRIQSFCISIGIIATYILYLILKMNTDSLPAFIPEYMNNKNVIIFGQWFFAILLGNVLAYWYILSIYRPLLPNTRYAGYSRSKHRSTYVDDIHNYIEHCEVHIGQFWDAERRRNKIEKIFKISKIILLIQLAISTIMFFMLK